MDEADHVLPKIRMNNKNCVDGLDGEEGVHCNQHRILVLARVGLRIFALPLKFM